MDTCPKCNGAIQIYIYTDADDNETHREFRCKRKFPQKKKKGCGYIKQGKAYEEWTTK